MRIVFMGTPDFSVPTLEALVASEHEVVGVVTQPDKPKGRGKTLMPTPVKEVALKHEIPVYQPKKVREAEFVETLRKIAPDVIVVAAFGQIITKEILRVFWSCRNTAVSTFTHPCCRNTAAQPRSSGQSLTVTRKPESPP